VLLLLLLLLLLELHRMECKGACRVLLLKGCLGRVEVVVRKGGGNG
jgi:hypothetical protein